MHNLFIRFLFILAGLGFLTAITICIIMAPTWVKLAAFLVMMAAFIAFSLDK